MGQHQHINVHFKRRTMRMDPMIRPRFDDPTPRNNSGFDFLNHTFWVPNFMAKRKLNQKKTPQLQMLKPPNPQQNRCRSNHQDDLPSADG